MPAESGRYYSRDGKLVDTALSADGKKMVRANITHARKLHLYPSTTTILQVQRKIGLERWKITHAIKIAHQNPCPADMPEDDWLDDIVEKAAEMPRDAAVQGSAIHGEIEQYLISGMVPFNPASERAAIAIAKMVKDPRCEVAFINERLGFAGTVDLVTAGSILDIKTITSLKGFKKPYYTWGLQLAAYCVGLEYPLAATKLVNLVVDRSTGDVKPFQWGKDGLHEPSRLAVAFGCLAEAWMIEHDYDPRLPVTGVGPEPEPEPKQEKA